MKVESKKWYKGNLEVKSYDAEKCFKLGEDLEIEHEGKICLVIPNNMIYDGRASKSKKQISTTGGEDYYLYGYKYDKNSNQ